MYTCLASSLNSHPQKKYAMNKINVQIYRAIASPERKDNGRNFDGNMLIGLHLRRFFISLFAILISIKFTYGFAACYMIVHECFHLCHRLIFV